MEVTRAAFDEVLRDPEGQRLMDSLELAEADRADLFDVLDADGSGHISLDEIDPDAHTAMESFRELLSSKAGNILKGSRAHARSRVDVSFAAVSNV